MIMGGDSKNLIKVKLDLETIYLNLEPIRSENKYNKEIKSAYLRAIKEK